ncbi:MAG: HD domain-containing protein [Candidatus Eremiobacteraeota bacterium]|nr:HD domain-containing protein [Candidatus Eremiobacteraeota bacterium]
MKNNIEPIKTGMEKFHFNEKMPVPVREFVARFTRKGHNFYLVGGSIRDLLLGKHVIDWDFAGDENFLKIAITTWKKKNLPYFMPSSRYKFARLLSEQEWYIDAQLMEGDLENDLKRRDYTVNAMAWDPVTKKLYDLHGGRKDLDLGILRAISAENFEDDPLRLLRGIRLEAQLGFHLDPETEVMIKKRAKLLSNVAGERIRDELFKILDLPASTPVFKKADELNLLGELFPQIAMTKGVIQNEFHRYDVFEHSLQALKALEDILKKGACSHPAIDEQEVEKIAEEELVPGRKRISLLKLATFLHDIGKPETKGSKKGRITFYRHQAVGKKIARDIASRLVLSTKEIIYITRLVEHHMRPILLCGLEKVSARARFRLFRSLGDYLPDLILLTLADMIAGAGPASTPEMKNKHQNLCRQLLADYYRQARIVKPPRYLDGNRIMELLDIPPGPTVGKILSDLEEASATGNINTKQDAEKYVIKNYSES